MPRLFPVSGGWVLLFFASDNSSGAAPQILDAIVAANAGYTSGYGADALTKRVEARLSEMFEREVAAFLVATGSSANGLALSVLTPPYGVVYCHDHAHIQVDEAGAPEFYTGGAKLWPLPGEAGRIDPAALDHVLTYLQRGNVHNPQPAVLSLTQVTEWGTVYTPDQIRALADRAKAAGMTVHMDGARFANAVAALGCTPAEMTWKAGVDAVVVGGTKNGCLGVEAVVFFDETRAADFAFRRKRGGHLFSKMRFLAAQMDAYLEGGLWRDLAATANARAARLARGLEAAGVRFAAPVEANEVFALMEQEEADALRAAGAVFYDWPFGAKVRRFVTSFATREDDVDALVAQVRKMKAAA